MSFAKSNNKYLLVAAFLMLAALLILSFSGEIGVLIWRTARLAEIAFFLNPTPELAFEIGGYYLHTRAYDLRKAERFYLAAYELNPDLPRLNYQLGRAAFIGGRYQEAIKYITREIELYPDFPRSFYYRGLVEGFAGKYKEAIADFKTFIERVPNEWAAYNDLAWIYGQIGKFEDAESYARRGLEVKPDNVWLLNNLGSALLHQGKNGEAEEVLRKAEKLAQNLTPENWIAAYPANNPGWGAKGVEEMRSIIGKNILLLESGGVDK